MPLLLSPAILTALPWLSIQLSRARVVELDPPDGPTPAAPWSPLSRT
jgi:hypothetical protein